MKKGIVLLGLLLISFVTVGPVFAGSLSTVTVTDRHVTLSATEGVEQIRYFTLDAPKRLVVDLYNVVPGQHASEIPLGAGFGLLRTGVLDNRTRFVFDVASEQFPVFNVVTSGDRAIITWEPAQTTTFAALAEPATQGSAKVDAIDFTSTVGQSRLLMTISGQAQASSPVRDGNRVQFTLPNTTLPRALRREFDTLAFPSAIHSATPYLVNVAGRPEVRMVVLLKGDVSYRLEKVSAGYELVVEDGIYGQSSPVVSGMTARPVIEDVRIEDIISEPSAQTFTSVVTQSGLAVPLTSQRPVTGTYTGEKTSLVFDNADVRDILRLIAEISDLNIIASDEVSGNVTLRLIDVPWDQALELILDVTGLGMIQQGNVVRVLPKQTIQNMREAEMTAARTVEQLETLVTEVITVSYADIASVVEPITKILSERGTLTPDLRNKLLIVNDIPARIERARELISILDTPERQVMIEARIVQVNSNYSRSLGVSWGVQGRSSGVDPGFQSNTGFGGNFLVNTASIAAGMATTVGGVPGYQGAVSGMRFGRSNVDNLILDLQLSALETDNKLKIISSPRITTLNGQQSIIKQGKEIPFERTDSEGVRTIEWKEAVLLLEVTPVINPDNSIILDIIVSNDRRERSEEGDGLDIKRAETKALIRDGETTVIGGIFIESTDGGERGIPGLMRVPLLGHLFKAKSEQTVKDELLIFITPRIVSDN